jgi:hypothetical protein
MAIKMLQRPIFFSIRKNISYFMWRPYEDFFDFKSVCIEALGEDAFVMYEGDCIKVQQLGRKYLVSATRFRKLKNGIYLLEEEKEGRYVFRLIKPLRRNV